MSMLTCSEGSRLSCSMPCSISRRFNTSPAMPGNAMPNANLLSPSRVMDSTRPSLALMVSMPVEISCSCR
ncbi:hypothetical protein D3C78_1016030 [compost metagenome]